MLINSNGFREYDARWLYPKDINKEGIKDVGKGFGSQIISKTNQSPRVIVGHDYRSYSEEVKKKINRGFNRYRVQCGRYRLSFISNFLFCSI